MSQVTSDSYINYFRTLAVIEEEIQHNPDSENNDSDPGEKRFTRWSADEAITSLRNKIGFPALLLEMYEVNTKSEVPYDVKGMYTGAFTILAHAANGDVQQETEALALTERIYQNILKMIYQDHYGYNKDRCSTPFTDFSFNNLDIRPIGPILDNEFGWRIEFNFKPKYLLKITDAPEYGTIEEVVPPGYYLLQNGFIEIPAGRLVERIYLSPLDESFLIAGSAEGEEDLLKSDNIPTPAGGDRTGFFDLVCKIPTRIWIGGIVSKTKVAVYTRRLP